MRYWAEHIVRSARLRWVVLLAGLFLVGMLYMLRDARQLPEPDPPLTTDASPEEESEDDDFNDASLPVPFYPNFETVWQLTTRAALEDALYAIDETAYVYDEDLDVEAFLEMDFSSSLTQHRGEPDINNEPRILIFHTHSQEAFIDSRPGVTEDTIVGVGALLAKILAEEHGVSVVHDLGQYDVVNGVEHREGSYERMEPSVRALLDKYPTIDITIDLHRDGVPEDVRLVAMLDGKPTARIMFFNGISRLNDHNAPVEVTSLPNPYITQTLGLSLQLQLTANTLYPGFARRIYIRPYRYSLHFKPKSMLIEVGANTSTLAEAQNAMGPLAEILMQVLN